MTSLFRLLPIGLLALGVWACDQSAHPSARASAAAAPGLNPNVAPYGPHGVSAVPAAAAAAAPEGAPPLDPSQMNAAAMAGHACACGGSCHCGHCSGAVPGCHCKTKRADDPGRR